MVEQRGYPKDILDMPYDARFAIRGLVVDKKFIDDEALTYVDVCLGCGIQQDLRRRLPQIPMMVVMSPLS